MDVPFRLVGNRRLTVWDDHRVGSHVLDLYSVSHSFDSIHGQGGSQLTLPKTIVFNPMGRNGSERKG